MGTWMFPPGASWERSSTLGREFSPQTHSIHRDRSSLPWNRDGLENKNSTCFWAGRVQKIHPCFIPIFQSESDLQGFFCQVIPWNSQAHAVLIQLHFGWKWRSSCALSVPGAQGRCPRTLECHCHRNFPRSKQKMHGKSWFWHSPAAPGWIFQPLIKYFKLYPQVIPKSPRGCGMGPWELHPQRYSHWKSISGAQPSHPSWKTAQPEQNHGWQPENQPGMQGTSIPPAGNTELRFLMGEEITQAGIGGEFQLVPG